MFPPNEQQQQIIDECKNWFFNSSEQVFQFTGGPGTGKSFTLNKIVEALGLEKNEIAPMAYIGAATNVLRKNGFPNAKTMHSWLYNVVEVPKYDKDGNIMMSEKYNRPIMEFKYIPKPNLDEDIKLIIVDEAGSMPMAYKYTIEKHGIKVIATGDLDQLPPVIDKPAYLISGKIYKLTQIMRQAENSSIIRLSRQALAGIPINKGFYGDVWVIDMDDLQDEFIAQADVLLCGRNDTRDLLNNYVRQQLLHIQSPTPQYLEKLVCVKNNWSEEADGISLTNGLCGRVMNQPDPSSYDMKYDTFEIDFLPDISGPDGVFRELEVSKKFITANKVERDALKNDKYIIGNKFEYGYALTTHKAQGSQWANGIFFEEYLGPDTNKLIYTALTRFSNSVIYVKHKKKVR